MGEIAESMLDGSCCEQCGEYLGEAVGYAQCCAACGGDSEREDSQMRRASNRESSNRLLRENGYTFDERNGAAHLIVQTQRGIVDFWPGTGKFIVRSTRYEARGVFNLMQHAAPLQPAAPLEIQWKPHMTPFSVRAYLQAGFILAGAPADSK